MAFDQATRNRLQRFVGDARKLLSDEFTQQLQNTYGLDPLTGGVAALSDLPALSPSEQQTAQLLRDTLEHYLATSHKADPHKDKALVTAALDRIVREQAFTVLNRLAALRMAEARQFVMESISQGYQSKGFQLYQRIAGSSLGETGQTYQHYLFSIFDELSLDLAVLFDRYSSQGRLFPCETVLLGLLELINHSDLEVLWVEDETIGWIYQYFNLKEERKKMRDESQAPRNSRELAVRNQFFTPRYVVEFLTDNTLGRIWYEMTQGNTGLVDSCQYLVRRPNEIFLKSGEVSPEQDEQESKELSQDELLQQAAYIQHRPIKDPRDIKMLDPACGSMHFGLYAFDLFEKIYSEAWDIEEEKGREIFCFDEGALPKGALHESYPSKGDFLCDVPRLIIEHNIHGVDIDSRAVQIAGLSLWLRAQKTWSENHIKPNERPQIQRSNIVCAEPMPGEPQLLKEFISQVQPRVLGQLVEDIFDKMQLAGEAGTLLKIEEEIKSAIEDAKSQKDEDILEVQGGLFGENKWEVREGKRYYNFGDVEDDFWGKAEQLILLQLEKYAESATGSGSGQKRLFAADAAKGFAFIDLCRKRFDVVLMNPPFGQPSKKVQKYVQKRGLKGRDLAADFVSQGLNLCCSNGKLGAITTRTLFFLKGYSDWRSQVGQLTAGPEFFVDLGFGVLDAAVETAAYTFSKARIGDLGFYYDQKGQHEVIESHGGSLVDDANVHLKRYRSFEKIPRTPLCYWASEEQLFSFQSNSEVKSNFSVFSGGNPRDDFRFVRHWIEVGAKEAKNYVLYSKGGEFSPYYYDVHLALNWQEGGEQLKTHCSEYRAALGWSPDWRALMMNYDHYFKPGITWPRRTSRLSFRFLPSGCVFGDKSPVIQGDSTEELHSLVAELNSSSVDRLVSLMVGSSELAQSFEVGIVSALPHRMSKDERLAKLAFLQWKTMKSLDSYNEISHSFLSPIPTNDEGEGYSELFEKLASWELQQIAILVENQKLIDEACTLTADDGYKFCESDFSTLTRSRFAKNVAVYVMGLIFGRWSQTEKLIGEDDALDPFVAPGFVSAPLVDGGGDSVSIVSDIMFSDKVEEIFGYDRTAIGHLLDDLGFKELRDYITRPAGLFSDHLDMYTKSKRQFPIYWPLQTPSGSFTLWIYYPKVDEQTLYVCVNDFVDPKIKNIQEKYDSLVRQSGRSSQDEKELERLKDLIVELKDFRDELLRVGEFWKPSFNDGVQVSAAPLWKLFRHSSWSKKLKETWLKLEGGELDWANLAFHIWPDRVLRKCHQDRSLAIAHDVREAFWYQQEMSVKRGKKIASEITLEWKPRQMSDTELDTIIQSMMEQG